MELKRLLKRGALLTGANWPTVVIQFAARTTFQTLLAVPVIGGAVLVALLLGADIRRLLTGGIRDVLTAVADALLAEPAALVAFGLAFLIALVGATAFMAFVKGGTVAVLVRAESETGPVEVEPLFLASIGRASRLTLPAFLEGSARHVRRFFVIGLLQLVVHGLSVVLALGFLAYGYRVVEGRALLVGWALIATLTAAALGVWITIVNLFYLLMQIAIVADDLGVIEGAVRVGRFIRAERRSVGGLFLVLLGMVVIATLASALAWSGVALVAFVPLVGLAVVPLQIAAIVVRGLVFEYIGLTGLGAYATLYRQHVARVAGATQPAAFGSRAVSPAR